ncbi:unnamed protein product [Auanema sp. JU1783]|nr:unnamed protein product [Auanema sp. JU1783]
MNINAITGLFSGLGKMLTSKVEYINVPEEQLMGKWFQMYKASVNFDNLKNQMYCPISYFSSNPIMGEGGFSMEEAYRVISKSGPIETYKRDVSKVGPGQYWIYTEEYFYPKQLNIIGCGPNYDASSNETQNDIEYFITTDSSKMSFSVYARDPSTFFQTHNKEVTEFMESKGFGGKAFWNSPKPLYQGPDCDWPTEKEVFARRVLKNQENEKQAKKQEAEPETSSRSMDLSLTDLLQNPKAAWERLIRPLENFNPEKL